MEYMESKYAEAKELTVVENKKTMKRLIKDWGLGPAIGIDNNQGNNIFWKKYAGKMGIEVAEARRQSCANCEHGKIDPAALEAMEHIPYNKFDKDGGMRVWCEKFDFVCHATRVCIAFDE